VFKALTDPTRQTLLTGSANATASAAPGARMINVQTGVTRSADFAAGKAVFTG
jgi:hypothetical protein